MKLEIVLYFICKIKDGNIHKLLKVVIDFFYLKLHDSVIKKQYTNKISIRFLKDKTG
jgi:hypothetical protein